VFSIIGKKNNGRSKEGWGKRETGITDGPVIYFGK